MTRSFWIALVLVAGLTQWASAQQSATYITFEPLSVGGASTGLTLNSVIVTGGHGQANYAVCRVETNTVRWMADGSALTSSRGTIAVANDILQFSGNKILQQLRFIATGSAATVNCTYADQQFLIQ